MHFSIRLLIPFRKVCVSVSSVVALRTHYTLVILSYAVPRKISILISQLLILSVFLEYQRCCL